MKRATWILVILTASAASVFAQGKHGSQIESWADSLTGTEKWLRIDVLKYSVSAFSGVDPTNVGPDKLPYYNAKLGGSLRSTQTQTADEFETAVAQSIDRTATDNILGAPHTWRYSAGTKVLIEKIKLSSKDIKIEIREGEKGRKTAVRLKFEKRDYTIDEVRELYDVAFSDSEVDLYHVAVIDLGMSIDEVIEQKGLPISRVNLGPKVILTYDDMKMIFEDGKLTDVQ